MLRLEGNYGAATIHAVTVEQEVRDQVQSFLNHRAAEGSRIEIMPDTHAGKGCVIGFTQTISDRVCPNLVGVDIGCGMLALKLRTKISPQEFVAHCRKVPVGTNIHQKPLVDFDLSHLHAEVSQPDRILRSIGTLGSGNHFIELEQDSCGDQYVVIHTGSRSLGVKVCNYHQTLALGNNDPLAYLQGERMQDYLDDMLITQEYARLNRSLIAQILGFDVEESFETVHNYISFKDMVLRKGAISCHLGEKVLIPLNMRDGSLIGIGKGCEGWNKSGPHGAGRVLSRSQARRLITLEQFQKSMQGIYSETVLQETIDESPMAYKNSEEIISLVTETIDIVDHLQVLANFKGF